ncbi:MAG: dephospho-CoA kinase, partial [Hyphomicrobiales bacterium]|nr:dephospho-CoA kinase [Hyphomicrobiales bacterium]
MIVAGLTGSIAMGKTTVARMFAALGAPVFDADAAVRAFYRSPGNAAVEAAFPGVVEDGEVNRDKLGKATLGDAEALKRLEAIVHPEVARLRQTFLDRAKSQGRRAVVVDVPLLFETGGDANVDLVLVVSAGERAQRARALSRPGMSEAKLAAILARQMPDAEKRRRAHFVIDTSS